MGPNLFVHNENIAYIMPETDDGKERKRNRLTAAFATTYNEANNSSDNDE